MAPGPGDPFDSPTAPSAPSDVFGKPASPRLGGGPGGRSGAAGSSGSAGRPQTAGQAPEPEPEPYVEPPKPAASAEPKVALSNLKWGAAQGQFNGKIAVSAEASVPADMAHLTKVDFQLVALTPDGKRENIDKQSGNLSGGKAAAEVTLFIPGYRDNGKLLTECKFVFTAKHRESREEESAQLAVKAPFASNLRFERDEGWVGQKVKVLADTILADDAEVDLTLTVKTTKVIEKKIKAKSGKLELEWTPCLCGIAAAGGTYPENEDATVAIAASGETLAAAKKYKLKTVKAAASQNYHQDHSWPSSSGINYGATADFNQKIENGAVKILVKKKIIKTFVGYWVDLSGEGITGQAGGCPYDGYRWCRITGVGDQCDEYYDGADWQPMPAGLVDVFWTQGFVKVGRKFLWEGQAGHEWPEAFTDYDFNATAYVDKRAAWVNDTNTRWKKKALLRPTCCPKGEAADGCGLEVELTLEWDVVTTPSTGVIYVAPDNFRSDAAHFSMADPEDNMVAHEVGHLVGNPDEYDGGGVIDTANDAADGLVDGLDATSVMGQSMDKVKKRHYVHFVAMAKKLFKARTGQDTDFVAVYGP